MSEKQNFFQKNHYLICLVLALLLAILSSAILPLFCEDSFLQNVCTNYLDKIQSTIIGCIGCLAIATIFLSTMNGIVQLSLKKGQQKGIVKLVVFYIACTFLVFVIGFVLSLILGKYSGNAQSYSGLFNTIFVYFLQIIPTNILSPFLDGNLLQIFFIAILCGFLFSLVTKVIPKTKDVIKALTDAITFILQKFLIIIPLYVFNSIFMIGIRREFSNYQKLALYLVVFLVTSIILLVLLLVITSILKHISMSFLVKNIMPIFITSFLTASSNLTLGKCFETCENEFERDSEECRMAIPFGMILFKPSSIFYLIVLMLGFANLYSVEISLGFYVTLCLGCLCLTITIPPVAGGGINVYAILCSMLFIPAEAVSIAIALDVILEHFITAFNVTSQLTIYLAATNKKREVSINDTSANHDISVV